MLSFLRNSLLFLLFVTNPFSVVGDNICQPEIATDSTGQYVYGIWKKSNNTGYVIQTARSTDNGENFVNPTITPSDLGLPNLSDSAGDAREPYIATNSTGQYVYAVWRRDTGKASAYIVQIAISSDYGVTWTNPTTTSGDGGSPNLSDNGGTAYDSVVTTDSTGQYVYVVWRRYDVHKKYVVQVAISSDYGANWSYPTTTTGDEGSPDLSDSGEGSYDPHIITNSTGQYIYAIWTRYNGKDRIVQVAISSDYGVNWENPTSVTGNGVPNLSDKSENVFNVDITTDSTGQYVYAAWQRNNIIQTAISSDYGVNWDNPTTTTGNGTPNLSLDADIANVPYIRTDSTGQNVYAIWDIESGLDTIVQKAQSSDYGVNWINVTSTPPPLQDNIDLPPGPQINTELSKKYSFGVWFNQDGTSTIAKTADAVHLTNGSNLIIYYSRYSMRAIFENEYVNDIYWYAEPTATSYKVYLETLSNLVYSGTDLEYCDPLRALKESRTYLVTWLDGDQNESDPSQITIE